MIKRLCRIAGVILSMVLTMDEALMIARVVDSEANAESEAGKRLVIDCVLNRVEDEAFPMSVVEVIEQKGQFSKSRKKPAAEDVLLVFQEAMDRTDTRVLWFRTKHYHRYGEPIVKEGSHYFSGKE